MEVITPSGRYPALKYADFRYFWIGQFISNTGTQMQIVAINWQLYVLTHSPFALGMIGLSRFIPIAVFSLLGGSFADVHNRKRIQFITQTTLAILSLALALTTIGKIINPFFIYAVTILAAITTSFDLPARQAMIPNLVEKKDLANAMSLNVIMFQVSTVAGPAIGGFVIGYLGVGTVYLFNALSFGAVITSLILIKNTGEPVIHDLGTKASISIHSILEGIRFVRSKTLIWSTMLLDFFSTFFASATVLLPVYAESILHVGPIGLGFLYSADSVGAVAAGLAIAHTGKIKKQGVVLLSAVGVFGLATILFGISSNYILSILALIILGAGDSVSTIIRNTIRQIETPDYIRGRMTSINMIFFAGGPQLGEFEAGLLASLVGTPLSVVLGGIGTLIVVGTVAYGIPTVRKYHGHNA
ncbi:MAG TPA: MFS transporter [Patescibacteria group bacterium]|nr:MFS transporter [Patescibacteria group bacterium]